MAALTSYSLHDTHWVIHYAFLLQHRVSQNCKGLPTSNFAGVSSQVPELADLASALGTHECAYIWSVCNL